MTRARSFWGWGWADRFPDEGARRTLAEQVSLMLGFPGLEVEPEPRLDAITLRAPRVSAPESLSDLVVSDHASRVTHSYGKAYRDLVRGFRGQYPHPPDLVAYPRTEADITRILDFAAGANVAVIPFGGGTSVVGGVELERDEAHRGVLSLDVRGLDRVLDVDVTSRTARIQAGATGPVLEEQLRTHDLTLRCFPQSFEHSTLGGWIATRAGGHFATLFTHIDDVVSATRMATPRGIIDTRVLPASGAGPSADRLVLGSEGIFGVITEATVRVVPRPRYRAKASLHFRSFTDAVRATRVIAQAGLYPSNCRLLDEREAALNGVAADGTAVLLVAFESADHPLDAWIARAVELAKAEGATCPLGPRASAPGDEAKRTGAADEAWKSAFIDAPYLQSTLVSLGLVVDTFETACPWSRFEELHAAVIDDVRAAMARVAGRGRISCRFTHVYPDGPAPYYTFVAPARRGAELEQWAEIKAAASAAILRAGGTITHHHAVGRTHKPWYEQERPALFAEALVAVKRTLDPAGIMNPGVLV
ncbi:FAD-binding oxidoreductase [Myxococcota bacterium]|nr:FAD-binding oxidoreductase [Myxococcota bacterium]